MIITLHKEWFITQQDVQEKFQAEKVRIMECERFSRLMGTWKEINLRNFDAKNKTIYLIHVEAFVYNIT